MPDFMLHPKPKVNNDPSLDILSGFHFHYDEASTIGGVLAHILADLAVFRQPHNWDEKYDVEDRDSLSSLASSARHYLDISGSGAANQLINRSTVEHVSVLHGATTRRPVIADLTGPSEYLFPSNARVPVEIGEAVAFVSDDLSEGAALTLSEGRIVQIDEKLPLIRRSPSLLLHVFCLRLQNEDPAFIRDFIQRHVSLQNVFKKPAQLQPMTPSDSDASERICYRRLSYSCHMSHLLLRQVDPTIHLPDLSIISHFSPKPPASTKESLSLCRSSSSVLLTFALPQQSPTRREELGLLSKPECLWSVLVLNCLQFRNAGDTDDSNNPSATLTPVAQFLHGIHSALHAHRINEQHILDILKEKIEESDDMSLFDDEHFSKTHLYHWAVKTCDGVCHSISSTLRFYDRIRSTSLLKPLVAAAHPSERAGIDLWFERCAEEILSLKELREEFISCRQDVQERRNALHGATGVLEARMAIRQGEQIKALTYLAIIFLPLSASASIYSINPLPESATLWSFIVFLVGLILLTSALGIGLRKSQKLKRYLSHRFQAASASTTNGNPNTSQNHRPTIRHQLFNAILPESVQDYIAYLKAVCTPPHDVMYGGGDDFTSLMERYSPPAPRHWGEAYTSILNPVRYLNHVYTFFIHVLHDVVVPWMAWPRTLLMRWRYRIFRGGYHWDACQFVGDVFMIGLSPVAVLVLCPVLLVVVVLMDGVAAAMHILWGFGT
ncbi:hypothetical protein B0T17DRAFT_543782 [Bombardia bombarda]|uniref:Uncharacterized protein n=1 Tax=Bombardia bombarda TaxID=252184 RepID=A0AA39TU06_9PEZI|nr:hypothetical protein B0T17DRAFT_543782 [Bombardia bombarda]